MMTFQRYLVAFICLIAGSLYSGEPTKISLDILGTAEIQQFVDKDIAISGYLYEQAVGEWVLSSEPNLKSCCVGKSTQISVVGDSLLPSLEKPIVVQGTLKPRNNTFLIDRAVMVKNEESHLPWLTFLIVVGLVIGALGLRSVIK